MSDAFAEKTINALARRELALVKELRAIISKRLVQLTERLHNSNPMVAGYLQQEVTFLEDLLANDLLDDRI